MYTNSRQIRRFGFKHQVMIAWLLGVITGSTYAVYAYGQSDFLQKALLITHVSFWGLVATAVLPLMIVSILLWFGRSVFAISFIGLKSVMFSFSSQIVVLAFSGAGWLVHFILMFTDLLSVFLLLLFSYQYDRGYKRANFYKSLLYIAIIMIFVCIDYSAIKPFIISLLNK